MRGLFGTLLCVLSALPSLVQTATAQQTPFQRLFDPTTTLTIILEMPLATWNQIANEQPVGGPCNSNLDPSLSRYHWHKTDATLITEGQVYTEHRYPQIGIKKKAFCASLDNIKPSLTLNLTKSNSSNQTAADNQIGTVHLSLENSKQDPDLFRQCAAYYVFQTMNIPAPMCTFVGLYRRYGASAPVFLGIYVLTEKPKRDFFTRRPPIQDVINGSLYEFEYPDDFTPATGGTLPGTSQLQVEWSSVNASDFYFVVGELQRHASTALEWTLDLPSFIDFWATEILLKSEDGYTNNTNNTFVFDGPHGLPIVRTRFRFIPHGLDNVVATGTKPSVYKKSILAQLAYEDNGLRCQLIKTLVTMGSRIENANVPAHIDSFVPSVLRSWRGWDPIFGTDDRNRTMQMAENVRVKLEQAILDLRTVFGHGLVNQPATPAFLLVGPYYVECMTRPTSSASAEVRRAPCAALASQNWVFAAAPLSMTHLGFSEPLDLYQVQNQGSNDCLATGAQFLDGSRRYKLDIAACDATSISQKFFLVRREGESFELHAFAQDGCAHFSGSVVTSDNRPAIYLGPCTGESKNLIVACPANSVCVAPFRYAVPPPPPPPVCQDGDERVTRCMRDGKWGFQEWTCRKRTWVKRGGCVANIP